MTSLKDQHELHMAQEFEKLLDWAGSPTYLAAFLKTTPQIVANWKARGRISATAAAEIEKLTDGKFTKRQLRPDVIQWFADQNINK